MQKKGAGSTNFYMNKPLVILPSADGGSSARQEILVVSTEKDTRILFETLLEIWGYKSRDCDNLEKALSIVKHERPKLILLDSGRPFDADLESLRRFRKNQYSKNIPIIVVSGFSQPNFRCLAMVLGADEFFVKPVDFDSLENSLKRNIQKYTREAH